jgi:hypothetical protein
LLGFIPGFSVRQNNPRVYVNSAGARKSVHRENTYRSSLMRLKVRLAALKNKYRLVYLVDNLDQLAFFYRSLHP